MSMIKSPAVIPYTPLYSIGAESFMILMNENRTIAAQTASVILPCREYTSVINQSWLMTYRSGTLTSTVPYIYFPFISTKFFLCFISPFSDIV